MTNKSDKLEVGLSQRSLVEETSQINRMGISIMSWARRHVLEDSDDIEPVTKIQEEYQKNKQKYDEFNEKNIYERKRIRTEKQEQKEYENISSDECKHNAAVFEFMKYQQRRRHIENLWYLTYKKAKAGSIMLLFLACQDVCIRQCLDVVVFYHSILSHHWKRYKVAFAL